MENLNKYISEKMSLLNSSEKTFKNIFELTHQQGDRAFSEITDGYKIVSTKYSEAREYCMRMGAYLKEKLSGVEKGSYVGLLMENSLLWVTSFWGILMAGYKPVLLNARLSKALNEEVISMTHITHIVSNCATIFDVTNIIVSLDNLPIYNGDEEFDWANEIALSTSATTLNVKVCVYDGNAICSQIMNTKRIVKENSMVKAHYKGRLKILAFLPFYHIFGLVATYFWFSFFGRTFVFLRDY